MKLTSWLAVLFAAGAITVALAMLFLGVTPDRFIVILIAVFAVAAAFFASPDFVNGWIQKGLDHLPSFGNRSSTPPAPPADGGGE